MAYVKITGPVRFNNYVGEFTSASPNVENMTIEISIDNENELHFVFTNTVHHILKRFSGRKFDSEIMNKTVDTMNSSKWDIVVGGIFAKELYENACLVAENNDNHKVHDKSPISILLKWASSSRFGERESESPASVAEVLIMNMYSQEDNDIESLFDTTKAWSELVKQSNMFINEGAEFLESY